MFHFANIFNSKFQNNYCFVQKLPLSINKKVQSRRFALQELLKQFLLMHHYCTSSFLFHKKVQSQRFAICTTAVRAVSYSIKKVQSQRFALQELLSLFPILFYFLILSLIHDRIFYLLCCLVIFQCRNDRTGKLNTGSHAAAGDHIAINNIRLF